MQRLCVLFLLAVVPLVCGHGSMTVPPSRNAGQDSKPNAGPCDNGACLWFSQGCTIGCPCNEDNNLTDFFKGFCNTKVTATINSPHQRTFQNNTRNESYPGVPPIPLDWSKHHPWRAPGTAVPLNPCGLSGGSTKNNDIAGGFGNLTIAHQQGYPGTALPPVEYKTVWAAGDEVEVAWNIVANHGGGYIYRLCPKAAVEAAGGVITEDCFWKHPLDFVGVTQELRWANGHSVEIDAVRVTEGTYPAGAMWTRNPIPACNSVSAGFKNMGCDEPAFPPPKGCNDTCWGYQVCYPGEFGATPCPGPIKLREIPQIVDKVKIPDALPAGDYVIGWRWDAEQTPQVWSGCGDVTVVRK